MKTNKKAKGGVVALTGKEWVDAPLEQWIRIEHDRLHSAPWCIIIADLVRARLQTRARAEKVVAGIQQAFAALTEEGNVMRRSRHVSRALAGPRRTCKQRRTSNESS